MTLKHACFTEKGKAKTVQTTEGWIRLQTPHVGATDVVVILTLEHEAGIKVFLPISLPGQQWCILEIQVRHGRSVPASKCTEFGYLFCFSHTLTPAGFSFSAGPCKWTVLLPVAT
jgi:hypothetical protein